MTATLGTLGIEETSLNLIKKKKKLYRKTTANVTPYTKTLDSIPMKSGARQEWTLSSLLFTIVLEILMYKVRKETKHVNIRWSQ